MRGGCLYGVRGKQLFLTLISISCTTILVWKWEKSSSPSTLVMPPPLDSLDSLDSLAALHQVSSVSDDVDDGGVRKRYREKPHVPRMVLPSSPEPATLKPPRNKECNYANGKWIPDAKRHLYSGFECKAWLSEMWACRLTERTDFSYEAFKWQLEDGCELPEFKPSTFLKRMKDKTIALVGDSLGRQQFQSLMCMLTAGKDDLSAEVEDIGMEYGLVKATGAARPNGWAYLFPTTNTTVLFYWSTFLCELEPLNISTAMHLDRPPRFLTLYLHRFDVLLLNTGHHWNRGKLNENRLVMHIAGLPVVDKKLVTMGNAKNFTIYSIVRWVNTQLPRYPQLKAFLRTLSPRHFVNGDWNTGGSCDNINPLVGGNQVNNLSSNSGDEVAEGAVRGTGVKLLDITSLSKLRDEAHISKYNIKATPGTHDCLHWCLPGIPDTWNEVFAAQI